MTVPIPTGVFDILPLPPKDSPWKAVHLWHYVEKIVRQVASDYGLSEIRTPIFERVELFQRSVGDETDIVSKEMYVFRDRGDREMALRPEGTASVMRALIENGVFSPVHNLRYFYIGPMFRYERPQAGRFRQHHQFGAEILGVAAPEQDAEMISLLIQLYTRLGLPHLKVYLNSLGDPGCRVKFREALLAYLCAHFSKLSEESQRRFERNPLRILDSKEPQDQEIVSGAPCILEFLSPEDSAHFQRVQNLLMALNVSFEINPLLVRGLDYYQRTVFEVTSGKLGAQNSVGGGGRYDGLLKQLGGPDLSSIGFGVGLERVIQLLVKEGVSDLVSPPALTLVILPLDERAKERALFLAEELRKKSVRTVVDFSGKKVKICVGAAADAKAEWLLVLGERELDAGKGVLKYLQDGTQTEVSLDQLDVLAHFLHSRHNKE
jgi:histidyl-tRNA synthetase